MICLNHKAFFENYHLPTPTNGERKWSRLYFWMFMCTLEEEPYILICIGGSVPGVCVFDLVAPAFVSACVHLCRDQVVSGKEMVKDSLAEKAFKPVQLAWLACDCTTFVAYFQRPFNSL